MERFKMGIYVIELENEEIILPPNCKSKPDNNNAIL